MSDLNAAATLSMQIDTGAAKRELGELRSAYELLRKEFETGIKNVGGAASIVQQMQRSKSEVAELRTALTDLETKVKSSASGIRQVADNASNLLKIQLKSAEMVGNDIIRRHDDNLKQFRSSLMKHFEMISRDAKASSAAIKSQMETLTATPVGMAEMNAYYRQIEAAQKAAIDVSVANIKAQEQAERTSSAERLKVATATIAARQKAEKEYSAWWEVELKAREKTRQGSVVDAVRELKAQEVAAKQSATEITRHHAAEVDRRRAAEKEYTAWWEAELSKRSSAAIRNAEMRSRMGSRMSAERVDRSIGVGTATGLADYYRSIGAAQGGGTYLQQMEQAAKVAAAEAEAATKATSANNELEKAKRNVGSAAKQSADHIHYWNKAANEGHAIARGLSGSLGTLWITYGSIIPLLAGAAVGSGFVQAAKQGAEFSYQLTFVKALSGETADAVDRLTQSALNLGRTSLQGPGEIASGFRILAQAGLAADDAIKAMPHTLHLATVGEMNMEQAATTLVGVMNAFGISVNNVEHVGDIFAKAAALSQTSVQGMTEAMKYASVVGEQYGANIEDTATAITLLAKVNITGTSAGTAFRNMLKELYSPTKQAAKVMEELKLRTSDDNGKLRGFVDIMYDLKEILKEYDKASQVKILQGMFGERGAKEAVAMLALERKKWDELRDSIANSDGFMSSVSKELEDSSLGQWKQAMNTLQAELITVFKEMEPEFKAIAVAMKEMFSDEQFKEGLRTAVSGLASLMRAAVEAAPTLLKLAEILVIYKVGTIASHVATAAWTASMGAAGLIGAARTAGTAVTLLGQTFSAVAAGQATTLAGTVGLRAALSMLGGPIGIVTGLLAAGVTAWALWGDAASRAGDKAYDSVKRAEKAMGDLSRRNKYGVGNLAEAREELDNAEKTLSLRVEGRVQGKGLEDAREAVSKWQGVVDALEREQSKQTDVTKTEQPNKTKRWTGVDGDKKGGKLGRDWDYEAEKAAIARVKDQQQAEIDVLESAHSNKLISEEKYRDDLAQIYSKYDFAMEYLYKTGLDRLAGVRDQASGDERKRAIAHYDQLASDQEKYLTGKELRVRKAADKELATQREAQDKVRKLISEAQANVDAIMERDRAARKKQTMSPEQMAAYDAGVNVDKAFQKAIADQEASVSKLIEEGYTGQNQKLVDQIALLDQLYASREKLRTQAQSNAAEEARYARTFESGWKNAYNNYVNNATNSAQTAQQMFDMTVGKMDSALEEFITTGTIDWQKLTNSIIMELIKIETRWLVSKVFNPDRAGDTGPGGSLLKMAVEGITGAGENSQGNPAQAAAAGSVNGLGRAAEYAANRLYSLSGSTDVTQSQVANLSVSSSTASGSLQAVQVSGDAASSSLQSTATNAMDAASYLLRMASSPMMGVAAGAAGGTGGSGLWGLAAGMIANYFVPGSGAMVSGLVNAGVGYANGNNAQMLQGLAGAVAGYGSYTSGLTAPTAQQYGTKVGSEQTKTLAAQDAAFKNANGNAFGLSGLQAFAKGGAFSNEVLSSSTFFKFADGGQFSLGVAGEAGPEAVMPLQRDSQGRLGVIAQQQGAKSSEPPPPPENNIRIVNAFDTAVIGDFMGSADGEKVIMNVVKRNPSVIKNMAR